MLGSLPTYYLSLFKASIGVLETLEDLRRKFLWGGHEEKNKIHWVSWEKVITQMDRDGLGVCSIRALNIGLIFRWCWRMKTCTSSLWIHVISCIHNLSNKLHDYLSKKSITIVWNNIVGAMKDIQSFGFRVDDIFKQMVKLGTQTLLAVFINKKQHCIRGGIHLSSIIYGVFIGGSKCT